MMTTYRIAILALVLGFVSGNAEAQLSFTWDLNQGNGQATVTLPGDSGNQGTGVQDISIYSVTVPSNSECTYSVTLDVVEWCDGSWIALASKYEAWIWAPGTSISGSEPLGWNVGTNSPGCFWRKYIMTITDNCGNRWEVLR